MKQFLLLALGGLALTVATVKTPAAEISTNRPFLAIWRDDEGLHRESKAPYLRIAIWDDGRVVYARDPGQWSHDLLEGRLTDSQVKQLKEKLLTNGVFELTGNCYLVPDAPVDCVMVACRDKQQMLYWDERESPNYGINIHPQEQHRKFIRCWQEVNRLALQTLPPNPQPCPDQFKRPPASWRLKPPIQSK